MSFEKSLEDSWEEIQDDNSSEEEEFLEDEYFFEEEDADAFFFCENENQGECADGCICDQSLFTFEEIIEEEISEKPQETEEERKERFLRNERFFKLYEWKKVDSQCEEIDLEEFPQITGDKEKRTSGRSPEFKRERTFPVKIIRRSGVPSHINFRVPKEPEKEVKPQKNRPCKYAFDPEKTCKRGHECVFAHTVTPLQKSVLARLAQASPGRPKWTGPGQPKISIFQKC